MPRPPDTYTHSQFEPIDGDNPGDTIRCVHCKHWSGNVKVLNRKKEHLLRCPQYAEWRAAGNGAEITPANPYKRRESAITNTGEDAYGSPQAGAEGGEPSYTPTVPSRARNQEFLKFFDEFPDESRGQKCKRVRCQYCGFSRAKNTTRQVEHLAACKPFLDSTEGQQAMANGDLQQMPTTDHSAGRNDIWRGGQPNPNLSLGWQGPKKPRVLNAAPSQKATMRAPSLADHLLTVKPGSVTNATHQSFLSHAGCGTLSAPALDQWLAQIDHVSRALVPFVGSLIGKSRIPETTNLQRDPTYRAMDLLISAVQNVKKELEFLEQTRRIHKLQYKLEEPKPAVKGLIDLLIATASPQASLLEGIVLLWAIEHLFSESFQYAASFISTIPTQSNYSTPSYLAQPGKPSVAKVFGTSQQITEENHIAALHKSLIPNWTSPHFVRFLDACKAVVDELANAHTSGNGRQEMVACERVFKQATWLWAQIWPEINGMGEEAGLEAESTSHAPDEDEVISKRNGAAHATGADGTIDIEDEDADETLDSPYGGTGLGAVAAANRGG